MKCTLKDFYRIGKLYFLLNYLLTVSCWPSSATPHAHKYSLNIYLKELTHIWGCRVRIKKKERVVSLKRWTNNYRTSRGEWGCSWSCKLEWEMASRRGRPWDFIRILKKHKNDQCYETGSQQIFPRPSGVGWSIWPIFIMYMSELIYSEEQNSPTCSWLAYPLPG